MFRFVFIILLHYILIFQIGSSFGHRDDGSTVCDCNCNCDLKIEVVNGELNENVHESDDKIDTKASNIEKHLLANRVSKPSSCMEAAANSSKSGIFKIQLKNTDVTDLEVFCENDVASGGWLVILRRRSTSVNFNRSWHDYKEGFGDLTGNYWIGLETLHALTSSCQQELYVQMKASNGTVYYAKYAEFHIASESESYALKRLGNYSGDVRDYLRYNLGMKFSTIHRDNDNWSVSCAQLAHAGWWFNGCIC
ncbi:angiopoietin-related protein 1 isoform X2 [Zeugodacus cucurbitae]|uniref:angiopoietin-related protein 1 isoform X2 n=1 Tax=Zeugodacus cucurbitae TaxID=28588 RepID=UPI0023D8F045|nr:angiopoietin-related protein 1 isoform X2 [Zeugodacus cucurbitae]